MRSPIGREIWNGLGFIAGYPRFLRQSFPSSRDIPNPIGQVLSLAMMLRMSFGVNRAADLIHDAVEKTLAAGWRTADLGEPEAKIVGTKEFGARIVQSLEESLAEVEDGEA